MTGALHLCLTLAVGLLLWEAVQAVVEVCDHLRAGQRGDDR